MPSNGSRQSHGFGPRAAVAVALVTAVTVATAAVRASQALHAQAERDAAREAELDEWASSDIR